MAEGHGGSGSSPEPHATPETGSPTTPRWLKPAPWSLDILTTESKTSPLEQGGTSGGSDTMARVYKRTSEEQRRLFLPQNAQGCGGLNGRNSDVVKCWAISFDDNTV